MNNESAKRRGWIKNIAIIFLVILLLLTFFSNTILTYSLPEVSAQYGQYGSLSSSVKLTGNVKANESYKVVYEPKASETMMQSRKVKSVYVREGDYVEKDQTILVVEGGMSEELRAAQAEYDEMKKTYDLALIGDNATYLQNSRTLEDAQSRYDDAKAELDEMKALYNSLMGGELTEDEKAARLEEIKEKRRTLNIRLAEIDSKIAQTQAKIDEAKSVLGYGTASGNLAEEEKKFKEISDTYESLKQKEASMSAELNEMRASLSDMRKANALTNEIQSLYGQLSGQNIDGADSDIWLKIAEAQKKLEILGLSDVSDIELFRAEHNLEVYEAEYNKAAANLAEYTPIYEQAKADIEALRKRNTASDELVEYTALLDVYTEQKKEIEKELENTPDIDELSKRIKEAEANVKSLKTDLDILKATTNQSTQSTSIDRNAQKKKLDELATKIEEYKNAPEVLEVNAPIAGRVVGVYAVPGDSVSSGMTVADIEIADKGYTCEVTITTEEARKISVGAPVTVSNSWWYSNIEASIIQIRSDVQSQGKNKIVIFEVKGDVYEGQQLTFSVGDRSASYDCVLPNSAIRSDSEGSFVLVVDSKKTPLGIRYKARRVEISVIASDDTKSAVSGLYGSEFVVTNATSPISDGQMVRLAEN